MYTCDDTTQIDIAYKRSMDNGKTWSALQVLYRGNSSGTNYNRGGNFAPVQLRYNQRILVPFCKNNLILMQSYSDDDGLTFSPAQVIYNVTESNWNWVALGPPSGLLLESNRILIPGDFVAAGSSSCGFTMLNDFNGQIDKWYLGGKYCLEKYHPNEGQAVELLPDANSIFVNARSQDTVRIGAYSNDGGITFYKVNILNTLVQPLHGCEGSTIYHQNSRQLFYTGVAETSVIRANLSLYISKDNGENWTYIKTIWKGSSAYSSLTILNDQSVAVLFEGDSPNGFRAPMNSLIFTIIYNDTEKKFFELKFYYNNKENVYLYF